jgi:hypothetical protein
MTNVGDLVSVPLGGLVVRCRVMGSRPAFGRIDLRVTPVSGSGEIWVDSRRVVNV